MVAQVRYETYEMITIRVLSWGGAVRIFKVIENLQTFFFLFGVGFGAGFGTLELGSEEEMLVMVALHMGEKKSCLLS